MAEIRPPKVTVSVEDLIVRAKVAHAHDKTDEFFTFFERIPRAAFLDDEELSNVTDMVRSVYVRCARYLINNVNPDSATLAVLNKVIARYEVMP